MQTWKDEFQITKFQSRADYSVTSLHIRLLRYNELLELTAIWTCDDAERNRVPLLVLYIMYTVQYEGFTAVPYPRMEHRVGSPVHARVRGEREGTENRLPSQNVWGDKKLRSKQMSIVDGILCHFKWRLWFWVMQVYMN